MSLNRDYANREARPIKNLAGFIKRPAGAAAMFRAARLQANSLPAGWSPWATIPPLFLVRPVPWAPSQKAFEIMKSNHLIATALVAAVMSVRLRRGQGRH